MEVLNPTVQREPLQPSTKLPDGLQEVDIVATHKVLCEVDDGRHQTLLDSVRENITQMQSYGNYIQHCYSAP